MSEIVTNEELRAMLIDLRMEYSNTLNFVINKMEKLDTMFKNNYSHTTNILLNAENMDEKYWKEVVRGTQKELIEFQKTTTEVMKKALELKNSK